MQTDDEQVQGTYPRVYKVDKATRRFFYGFAIFLVVFLGLTLLNLLGVMKKPAPLLGSALGDAAVAVIAVISVVSVERRVVLHEDAIEVAGVFSSRRLSRSEIRGRRVGKVPKLGASYYILVPADGSKPELKLPPFLHIEKCFFGWMSAIPEVTRAQRT